MSDVSSFLHRFWSNWNARLVTFCSETTNENNQFSKWEIWIFNAILDQTKLWRVLLWFRIEIMSAVTLNLSIDSILIKLKKEIEHFFFTNIMKSTFYCLQNQESKVFSSKKYPAPPPSPGPPFHTPLKDMVV